PRLFSRRPASVADLFNDCYFPDTQALSLLVFGVPASLFAGGQKMMIRYTLRVLTVFTYNNARGQHDFPTRYD
ncbi:MAG: hypothetical protein OEV47_17080, partial [Gammaproteobacteria bacterium]|nr:hypothetical protein [Gammaproteobacteria bacterium]